MMRYWQEAVVALLLAGAVVYVLRYIWTFLHDTAQNNNPCRNCTSDCKLRDSYQERGCGCQVGKNNLKKKCPK